MREKGLSEQSSIDFEKIQSFFERVRTKQIPNGRPDVSDSDPG